MAVSNPENKELLGFLAERNDDLESNWMALRERLCATSLHEEHNGLLSEGLRVALVIMQQIERGD